MSIIFDKLVPPQAKINKHQFQIHGQIIEDNYHWMRSKNWPNNINDPEILSYLNEENDYYNSFMSQYESQKEELFEELKGRIKLSDQSTYSKKDDYYYYNRTEKDKDYPLYCRKKHSIEADEEVILNVNEIAKGKEFTTIGAIAISPDHNLLAYSVDFAGDERFTLKIFNLQTQQFLNDEIAETGGKIVWHKDQSGFFYTPVDEKWRRNKVMFHKLGDKIANDQLIFEEKDQLFSVNLAKSSSEEFLFINSGGHDRNEVFYLKLTQEDFTPKPIKPKKKNIEYSIDHDGENFYQYTNDGAVNFHILKCTDRKLTQDSIWQEYIKHDKTKYLAGFDISKNYLLLNYKKQGLPQLIVKELYGNKEQIINFPDAAYSAAIYVDNFFEDDLRISYSSLSRPTTIYNYDFASNGLTILKRQEIPSGLDSDSYMVERVMATSDGKDVPISLIYKKSLFKKNGDNPLYLYGYGSYGIGIPPSFRSSAISLVDRGFVFAIAHIRGGNDLGHDWYEAAKFLSKKLTFTDFIASAEYLCHHQYTKAGNIIIAGGSAGGMLVGNVINQRPDLFKAAIAHVPFVDVLNTMLDEDLPLTPGEFKEWGNPKEKEYFEYIKSYCPYSNIQKQNYPNLLVTAGLSDPRVGYWEAAKWVAKLREYKTDDNIIIYKTNMNFGHQGASGRFEYLKETAEDLVFALNFMTVVK